MNKPTELAIRTHTAIRYPGWRVDFTGPATAVLTNAMGQRRFLTVRQGRHGDGPWMWVTKRVVPAAILMGGMVVTVGWMMALVMGQV